MTKKPSIAEMNPKVASQADGWDPSIVTPSSNRKLNWKCDFGHQWSAVVASRNRGIGCPVCSNQQVLAGYNDLATMHPDIASQADAWDATTVTAGSNKKLRWKCSFGHVWDAVVHKRVGGSGCPICTGHQVLAGYNDLATTHPDIASQADGWDPTTFSKGSNKYVLWKCQLVHSWKQSPGTRTSNGNGCPVCSNQQVLAGYNDLATTHPDIASQADGWDPTTVTRGHNSKRRWECINGHHWETSVSGRTGRQSGCPICVNQQVLAGFNDLATINPELAAQADGWDASTVTPNARKTVAWKCNVGHTWNAAIYSRASGNECPICSNKQLLVGYNDLATTHPEIASQADGWDPTTVSFGSGSKYQWKCELGHFWKASPNTRSNQKTGCPTCSGKIILSGFNDLATLDPLLASEAYRWDPRTVTVGSSRIVKWECIYGHRWDAVVSSRTAGNGCPSCAKFGFKPSEKAWLYLITNVDLGLLQIGITNNPEERLNKHRQSGFDTVLDVRGPLDGSLARDLERSCLNAFVKRGAKFVKELDLKHFDGWTESWASNSLTVTTISGALEWVYEDEGILIQEGKK